MIIQAGKGIEISEATRVSFKNVKVVTPDTNPVVDIVNSNNVSFYKFIFPFSAELLFRIGGERTENISIRNSITGSAKQKAHFEFGAKEGSLILNQNPQ